MVSAIRRTVWLYVLVNASHILGIALLVGPILVLDGRVLGLWKPAGWRDAVAVLSPVAALGLVVAIITGGLLFAVRAGDYLGNPALWSKWALMGLGLVNVAIFHALLRRHRGERPSVSMRLVAGCSASIWIGALLAGRWIAYS